MPESMVFLLALAVFLVCILSLFLETKFYFTAKRSIGEVVKLNSGRTRVTISFVTDGGELISYTHSGYDRFDVGEKVTVLYDADRPRAFSSVDSVFYLWGWTIHTFVVSVLLFLCSGKFRVFK